MQALDTFMPASSSRRRVRNPANCPGYLRRPTHSRKISSPLSPPGDRYVGQRVWPFLWRDIFSSLLLALSYRRWYVEGENWLFIGPLSAYGKLLLRVRGAGNRPWNWKIFLLFRKKWLVGIVKSESVQQDFGRREKKRKNPSERRVGNTKKNRPNGCAWYFCWVEEEKKKKKEPRHHRNGTWQMIIATNNT